MKWIADTTIAGHLWQSTLVFGLVALLTRLCRDNRAIIRYRLWVAASLKFLIPLSLLVHLGSTLGTRASISPNQAVSVALGRVLLAPDSSPLPRPLVRAVGFDYLSGALFVVWAIGALLMALSWWRQWRVVQRALRNMTPCNVPRVAGGMPVYTTSDRLEPAIVGVWRQMLLLPAGIADRLTPAQFDAVIVHERSHFRRRDNLIATVHQVALTLFWFHPALWYIGARLTDERERASDEEVIEAGFSPEEYADSLVKVCQFYMEAPLASTCGVTGSILANRVRTILNAEGRPALSVVRRSLLFVAPLAIVVATVSLGVLGAASTRAAAQAPAPAERSAFEAASVKPNDSGDQRQTLGTPGGGRFVAHNATVEDLIREAYGLTFEGELVGLPGWGSKDRFDVEARAAENVGWAGMMPMLQTLLADRFSLRVHRDTKEMPAYALRISQRTKLVPTIGECPPPPTGKCGGFTTRPGHLTGRGVTLDQLARLLSGPRTGRPVIDDTRFTASVDLELTWTPDVGSPADTSTTLEAKSSIFMALQDQLGLRLDPVQAPRERVVVDAVSRPAAN